MSSLAASADTLGTVVHELRQPLSNIETIAYYLSMVLPRDDAKIQAHLARIRELVQESNEILSSRLLAAGDPAKAEVSGDGMLP
jgi:phosphoglycerate-specific signal transduction histidine kinase